MKDAAENPTGLKEYVRKRNFKQTSEPKALVKKTKSAELSFVIQKHDASRLHYDFRLEMEGVLKSWAVPKGLPIIRGERHLAVHVEDHPMDYAHFEGTIPPGNYGAGTVMVWDVGTYSVYSVEPLKALKEGKIHLELKGKKLKGEWTLVRLKARSVSDKDNWLIFKTGADHKPLSKTKGEKSILTGRSLEQISTQNTAQWKSNRSQTTESQKKVTPKVTPKKAALIPKTSRRSLNHTAKYVEPMKCKLLTAPPTKGNWIYELKFDGFRALCVKNGKTVDLYSRAQNSLNARYPEIVAALQELPIESCIIDGELVALDDNGRSSFQLLQNANYPSQKRPNLSYYAFDFLEADGEDLKKFPLTERKKRLQTILESHKDNPLIRYSAGLDGDPVKILAQVQKLGMEGIIAKQSNSHYEPGQRSGVWVKIKVVNQQEFVIGGYTEPKGSRDHFGALLVGYYKGDKLMFASKVGTGFTQNLLRDLNKKFAALKTPDCPFANLPEKAARWGGLTRSAMRLCTWVKPQLVCQVTFTEWTNDGHLRHPAFIGLRDDKPASEVIREG